MNALSAKLKEVLSAVIPITALVLLLNFTLVPLGWPMLARFLVGSVFISIGLSLFLFGIEIGVGPIGNILGAGIAKSNRLWIVVAAGLVLGFLVSFAEPDLRILAGQIESASSRGVNALSIVAVVSVGIAVMLTVGLLRIVYNIKLRILLAILYIIILILAFFISPEYLAIAFDASGATTGAMTVPFILALAAGIAVLKKNSESSEEDSFGLVAIASAGAIIAVLITGLFSRGADVVSGQTGSAQIADGIIAPFLHELPKLSWEVFIALFPIALIFAVFEAVLARSTKRTLRKIGFGLVFAFAGLLLFLAGVNSGFMDVGRALGEGLAGKSGVIVVAVGFVLGLVTILAEPAVHVLTQQIEDVTSGYVNRKIVMFTLAAGVASAIALSMLRILVPGLMLWHFLLPGYLISTAMTFFVPELFVGIAYDSGGVASGPMTATFILAFAQGVAGAAQGADILADGFGIIALVAMTPLIALQALGVVYKIKSVKKGVGKNG